MNQNRGNLKLSTRLKKVVSNSSQTIKPLVKQMLSGNKVERANALRMVCDKGGVEAATLGRKLVKSKNTIAASEGIYLIGTFGTRKDLPLLNTLMYSKNPFVKARAIEMMGMCREPECIPYLKARKSRGDLVTRKNCNKALSMYKEREFELYHNLSENKNFKDPKRSIVRKGMDKDGSSTVLLGGKLFDKAIIRGGRHSHFIESGKKIFGVIGILPSSVDLWINAFEFDWRKVGLKHNPIEPILKKNGEYRIFRNRDGTLRVSTGVIKGQSLSVFQRKHPLNDEEYNSILDQTKAIEKGLDLLKINHQHLHKSNYVVEMVNSKPRVHVIDFDAAELKK